MIPATEQRSLASPFRRLLLTDYYDGAKAGLAVDVSGQMYLFELLDWDDLNHIRVFRVSIIPGTNWREVEMAFAGGAPSEWTEWVLPPVLPHAAEDVLRHAEASARLVAIVGTSDLLGTIDVWRPVNEIEPERTTPDWLGRLGLPRRI